MLEARLPTDRPILSSHQWPLVYSADAAVALSRIPTVVHLHAEQGECSGKAGPSEAVRCERTRRVQWVLSHVH